MTDNVHVMLDLETAGIRAGCAILQIGAVVFDPEGGDPYIDFRLNVSLDSCRRAGLAIDGDTLGWWLRQPDAARNGLFDPPPLRLAEALGEFRAWLYEARRHGPPETVMLWSHGAAFDVPILEAAFAAVDLPIPWCYRNVRDTRTLFDLAGMKKDDMALPVVGHDALHDAVAQARSVQAAMRKLRTTVR